MESTSSPSSLGEHHPPGESAVGNPVAQVRRSGTTTSTQTMGRRSDGHRLGGSGGSTRRQSGNDPSTPHASYIEVNPDGETREALHASYVEPDGQTTAPWWSVAELPDAEELLSEDAASPSREPPDQPPHPTTGPAALKPRGRGFRFSPSRTGEPPDDLAAVSLQTSGGLEADLARFDDIKRPRPRDDIDRPVEVVPLDEGTPRWATIPVDEDDAGLTTTTDVGTTASPEAVSSALDDGSLLLETEARTALSNRRQIRRLIRSAAEHEEDDDLSEQKGGSLRRGATSLPRDPPHPPKQKKSVSSAGGNGPSPAGGIGERSPSFLSTKTNLSVRSDRSDLHQDTPVFETSNSYNKGTLKIGDIPSMPSNFCVEVRSIFEKI